MLLSLSVDPGDPILGFTVRWIRALAEHVEEIHVIAMKAGRVDLPDNVTLYSVGKERGYSEARRALIFYRQLFHVLRTARIDVCFAHMNIVFGVMAGPLLLLKGIPLVTWYAHRQVSLMLKVAYHLSSKIVSINQASYPYRKDRFVSCGHGIDTALFIPGQEEQAHPDLLLSVGRLSPIKGLMTLLEAVALLRQKGLDVVCALVGDPTEHDAAYAESLRARARELGLEGAVRFVGAVDNTETVAWYRRCALHINCSPADHSLDKAALEAMACGKPSLSSTRGFRETMGDWAAQLLFVQDDAHDLALKIEHVLQMEQAEREKMSGQLCDSIAGQHSLGRLSQKLVTVFSDVMQERKT